LDFKGELSMNPMKTYLSKIACLLLVVLSISSAVSTQTINDETLKQIEKIMEKYKPTNPGCQLSISQKGKVIFSKAYGMADIERNVPLTTESVLDAGSVSKQFTAAAILLLEQQGKLSLQDDIRKYLPEMPNYGVTVTLGQMMYHTSGLRDWLNIAKLTGWDNSNKVYSNNDVLEIMMRQKALNFKPGELWSYSDSNYNLLAIVVERVSGMSLAEFTKKHIFEPAGMNRTQWKDYFKKIVPNRAIAYGDDNGVFRIEMPIDYTYGDTALLTTTEDLLKWNAFYLSGKFGNPSLLDKQTQIVPYNNGKTGTYAAGLFVGKIRGWKSISHTGASRGYLASLEHFPEADLSIAWLSNTRDNSDSPPVFRLVRNLFITNKNPPPPKEPEIKAITLTAEQLKKYEGWYREESWGSGSAVKLAVKDGKLEITEGGGGTIVPTGKDTFAIGSSKVQYFESSKKMVFTSPDETTTLTAVEGPVINEKTLSEYSGVYYSDETESKMTFKIKDGKLLMSFNLNKEFGLKPLYKDRFRSQLGDIIFVTDKKKKIVGFKVSEGRADGIKFDKILKKK
jgi:CubicO group peptidase (beta-lactamase class C family)